MKCLALQPFEIRQLLHEQQFARKGNIELYLEIKCQLDATEVFIADLIACSTCFGHHYAHHQELKYYTVVAACGISCCGFQVAGLVWS